MNKYIEWILWVIVIMALMGVSEKIYDRHRTHYCYQLKIQADANIYNRNYYITWLDKEECLTYGIDITANVYE